MQERGWDQVDVVLVTGDAYIDHPSFGISLIGRWLEAHGFRVGIISQPRLDTLEDISALGRPRLFFGVSAGNLDSIVANYTGNCRVRDTDAYSPEGNPYFPDMDRGKTGRRRPDRAVIRYANLVRQAFPGVFLVAGGLEASLRRFIHYDFQQQLLRNSILTDAKADLLVYGMGERAILEIARMLDDGVNPSGIAGTCERLSQREFQERIGSCGNELIFLPSWNEIAQARTRFLEAEIAIDRATRSADPPVLVQRQKSGQWIWQNRRASSMTTTELDQLYELPFSRMVHPFFGQVPAYEMIRHSITVVRGCCGNCAFCAINRHQGARVVSRSPGSVIKEAEMVAAMPGFRGTITDLGGPTANLYGVRCDRMDLCSRRDCLFPSLCRHLKIDGSRFSRLLQQVSRIKGVEHLFVSSGLRMDLLIRTPELLERIVRNHTPGALKIAPEHTESQVLRFMHKPDGDLLVRFLKMVREIKVRGRSGRAEVTAYFITAHPGCTLDHMKAMARRLRELRLSVRQFQDFTPTPGTLSTAMYVTGLSIPGGKRIFVARKRSERAAQRRVLERLMIPQGGQERSSAASRIGRSERTVKK